MLGSAMDATDASPLCLIVLEAGSEWPAFVHHELDEHRQVVIEQSIDETPTDLATRVGAQLTHPDARALDIVVIAVGPRNDDNVLSQRYAIARALLARRGTKARLLFVASATTTDQHRRSIIGFAGALTRQVRGAPLIVGVRFAAPQAVRLAG